MLLIWVGELDPPGLIPALCLRASVFIPTGAGCAAAPSGVARGGFAEWEFFNTEAQRHRGVWGGAGQSPHTSL